MNKNIEFEELLEKQYVIERVPELDTYGTGGAGLLVRAGIRVYSREKNHFKDYQIKFSWAGYGKCTQELRHYNNEYLDHHIKHFEEVNKWLDRYNLTPVKI